MPLSAADAKRIAELSDPFDPDRSDLDVYLAMVEDFGASSVLDVGCGTGTFACLLAARGIGVVAVDPDGASVDIARMKPGASAVQWFIGDAPSLPPLQVDAAVMTGNVETWCDLLDDTPPLASFRWTNVFESDGAIIESDTTLRFRTRDEVERQLVAANFAIDDVRDAPDRPGREFVFVCSSLPAR